ncbi:MAG: helix-turn-helix transcriptional regulator [Ramlibacter sp.]|nr:helix-turn-helix transcriptional regulator [Ramlibacter sp.]
MLLDSAISVGALLGGDDAAAGSGLALVMDELAHGIVVTTVEGRVLHANQAARHELARRRALGMRHSWLQAFTGDGIKTLQDALSKAADGKRSLIDLAADDGPCLTLAVLPLKTDPANPVPRAALLFARASVCESLMLCFFARSHGLTATEEQVLGILCQGFSAPQIARQLGVAVSTVRSHVRSLCAKTRSSGVRELVNRVAVLPPVAAPFRHEPMH